MKPITEGPWRASLQTQGKEIPFIFEARYQGDTLKIDLINGEERIAISDIQQSNDTLFIPMHIFDADIIAKITDQGTLEGFWVKNYVENYRVPFTAKAGAAPRFSASGESNSLVTGKWEVTFTSDGKTSKAIGIFDQNGQQLSGTFLTATGDYRYLDGVVNGNSFAMSAFDGEHAYLFEGTMQGDSIQGEFWSGLAGYKTWQAVRNESAELPDAHSLTFLKEGYDKLAFDFPGITRERISLNDEKYQGKVVLVQIFGTWCPNCMDETAFLSDWYRKNQSRGVEIIGLAYEKKDDLAYAKTRVEKVIKRFDVGYDFAFAGISDNAKAAETLPMLNHVMSFPTLIVIDKTGKVRRIHTGFSGPGTGSYYQNFVEDFARYTNMLLEE
ncbi:TlpA disulfide reductase family protein [Cytophagales bacterium LB-30]|uniref:TlpA disulfide reductase family protein n=1 Tax=Shiella aurantiaca TaxID=3058365 RepID=A0ABT8F917_9BACT|nr:TlpA disulfide reductase family protein [Shiella aurantiaca]MDN4166966.1 TlpA disulfide reductase family protein [Shiella aurantiaca]